MMNDPYNQLFDFDDILIEPTILSKISSRGEINSRNVWGNLPLMTAPMDTVVSQNNFHLFKNEGILPVLPRIPNPNNDWYDTNIFLSYSLQDFEKIFLKNKVRVNDGDRILALIDVANGHMELLYDMAKEAKKTYGYSMCLMIGNVANPKTFQEYCKIGVDLVRIGIGNGNGCLTTVQTGVGYPMASLIDECNEIRTINNYRTEIVADGGFKKEESKKMFHAELSLYKTFRGMSTKEVQKSWGKEDLTTSEGVIRRNKVEYTLSGWVKNFEDYLRSAMSYTGKKELHRFIGGVNYNIITQNSFRRFDK